MKVQYYLGDINPTIHFDLFNANLVGFSEPTRFIKSISFSVTFRNNGLLAKRYSKHKPFHLNPGLIGIPVLF